MGRIYYLTRANPGYRCSDYYYVLLALGPIARILITLLGLNRDWCDRVASYAGLTEFNADQLSGMRSLFTIFNAHIFISAT